MGRGCRREGSWRILEQKLGQLEPEDLFYVRELSKRVNLLIWLRGRFPLVERKLRGEAGTLDYNQRCKYKRTVIHICLCARAHTHIYMLIYILISQLHPLIRSKRNEAMAAMSTPSSWIFVPKHHPLLKSSRAPCENDWLRGLASERPRGAQTVLLWQNVRGWTIIAAGQKGMGLSPKEPGFTAMSEMIWASR